MNALANISVGNARLPAAYEAAKQALANCESVDECKDWADKAAALASYAKQASDEELMKQATRIRDRAIRRAGELLKQFDGRGEHRKGEGALPSSREMADSVGFSNHQHKQAVRVANVPSETFEQMVESKSPPSLTALANIGKTPRPVLDLKGRDPRDFNQAMHFEGLLRDYSKDLAKWNLSDLLPRLVESERASIRTLISRIDTIHDTIMTRI